MDFNQISKSAGEIKDLEDHGNFCVIDYDTRSGSTIIKTNRYRGFMMWYDQHGLSNLVQKDYPIWADSSINIDQSLRLHETKVDVIGKIDESKISRHELVDFVHNRLIKKIKSFLSNNHLPLRVFCSGGIDSMLVFSYIQALTDRFEMVWTNRTDWDEFWCRNQHYIRSNFWAYNQIHHWTDPCVLTSGAPGDEFMLRSPTTANLWLRYNGTSIPTELSSPRYQNSLHSDYFRLTKHLDIFEDQKKHNSQSILSIKDFYWKLCNMVINDCQHWHLGQTLTFTPLRDLEIFKKFLRLSPTDALSQIMDSSISKELIARNDPSLLDYLSGVKNVGESYARLPGLMSRYPAVSGQ